MANENISRELIAWVADSRILKLPLADVPVLGEGRVAWTTDTQQLFLGSDLAGNTEIGAGGGGGTGDVAGPSGGVADDEIVLFNGTSGKVIKGSGVDIADVGDVSNLGTVVSGSLAKFQDGTGKLIAGTSVLPSDVSANTTHRGLSNNPHSVTAAQTGASDAAHEHIVDEILDRASLGNVLWTNTKLWTNEINTGSNILVGGTLSVSGNIDTDSSVYTNEGEGISFNTDTSFITMIGSEKDFYIESPTPSTKKVVELSGPLYLTHAQVGIAAEKGLWLGPEVDKFDASPVDIDLKFAHSKFSTSDSQPALRYTTGASGGYFSFNDPLVSSKLTFIDTIDGVTGTSVVVGGVTMDSGSLEASVITEHEGALTITKSQVSDFAHTHDLDDITDFDDIQERLDVDNEPTGFPNRTDSLLSTKQSTMAMRISATGFTFDVWVLGQKFTKSGIVAKAITDTEGLWYLYFDENGDEQVTQTFSVSLAADVALVSVAYWSVTVGDFIYLGDERHGLRMDGTTHAYLHLTRGTAVEGGLGLGDIDADASGNNNTSAQLSVAAGTIWDEDIQHVIPAQSLPANLPIWSLNGAAANWTATIANDYPVQPAGTGDRIMYNEFSGGVWSGTEVTSGKFTLAHIFVTNDSSQPYIVIMGQAEYTTRNNAREGATTEIGNLYLNGLPFAEFSPVGTVIFQTANSYSNDVKARIISDGDGNDYIPWVGADLSPGSGPGNHDNLLNVGTNRHTDIDVHIALVNEHIDWTGATDDFATDGDFRVGGDVQFEGTLIEMDADIISTGDAGFDGTVSAQDFYASGGLEVDDDSFFHGANMEIDGFLYIDNDVEMTGTFDVDTIDESTLNAGVTVDGVLHKDGVVYSNPFIHLTKTSASVDTIGPNNSVPLVDIRWDSELHKDTGFTHSTVTSSDDITVTTAGRYSIKCTVNFIQKYASGRMVAVLYPKINGTANRLALSKDYSRGSTYGARVSNTVYTEIELAASDVITFEADITHVGSGTLYYAETQYDECELIIRRID